MSEIFGASGGQNGGDVLGPLIPTELDSQSDRLDISAYNVRERLVQAGAPEDKISRVIDENGEWALYGRDDILNLYDRPFHDVRNLVRGRLLPVIDLVDYALRSEKWPDGFNRHDIGHIDAVTKTTERLLRHAKHGDEIARLAMMASLGHDLGNLLTRSGHSMQSDRIFEIVAPSVLQNPGQWEAVRSSMRLHDEKAIYPLIKSWGNEDARLDVEGLRELGPITCALILADKTDVGRHRANEWALNEETMSRDNHAFANFFGENAGFQMIGDTELIWHVRYDPSVNESEMEKYGDLVRKRSNHPGYALRVPAWLHENNKRGKISHFSGWEHEFMKIYKERLQLSAKCAFALFPQLQSFRLEMHDPVEKDKFYSGKTAQHSFMLEYLNQQISDQNNIYTPKEEKKRVRIGS